MARGHEKKIPLDFQLSEIAKGIEGYYNNDVFYDFLKYFGTLKI